MKVADIAEFYSEQGGGVKTYIDQKLEFAAAHGIDMTVLAPGRCNRVERRRGGRIQWIRYPAHPLDRRYGLFTRAAPVYHALGDIRPDVVEGSSPWRGGWFAGRWQGPAVKSLVMHADPVAVYAHTAIGTRFGYDRTDRWFAWFWRYLQRLDSLFDLSVVASSWLADRFEGLGLRRPAPVRFGIDRSVFSPRLRCRRTRRDLLERCGLRTRRARLLITVSRHHPEKRIPAMMRAVSAVPASTPVGLVVVGDGPMRKRIEKEAARHPHVHILGPVFDRGVLARCLASADAMVHGSAAETYGMVVAEALSSGLPIIVPDRGGAVDLAGPGYAETYEPGSIAGLVGAIGRLLARDRDAMSQEAVRFACTGVRPVADHFAELFATYEQRLSSRGAGRRHVRP